MYWSRYDTQRASAAGRGYDSRWQKARKAFFARSPLCNQCLKNGKITAATVVDHVLPHRGNMKLFWDTSNWQSLCSTCHAKKTAFETGHRIKEIVDGQK